MSKKIGGMVLLYGLLCLVPGVQADGLFDGLMDRAKDSAERKTRNRINQRIDQTVDNAINKTEGGCSVSRPIRNA